MNPTEFLAILAPVAGALVLGCLALYGLRGLILAGLVAVTVAALWGSAVLALAL
jgi:hypothetical protein